MEHQLSSRVCKIVTKIDQTVPLRLRDTRDHVRRNKSQGYVVGTSPRDVIRCIPQGYPRDVIQGRYRDMFQGQVCVCVCDYTFYLRSIYPRGNLSPRRILLVNCTARTNCCNGAMKPRVYSFTTHPCNGPSC